jgi:hypothetical protein
MPLHTLVRGKKQKHEIDVMQRLICTTLMSATPSSGRVNLWLHWKQWTSGVAGQGRRHSRHDDG